MRALRRMLAFAPLRAGRASRAGLRPRVGLRSGPGMERCRLGLGLGCPLERPAGGRAAGLLTQLTLEALSESLRLGPATPLLMSLDYSGTSDFFKKLTEGLFLWRRELIRLAHLVLLLLVGL